MYDDSGESLFGHDGRHKPNPIPELLTEIGWGSSHGRLAFTGMNRQQATNYSEYAMNTIGMVPQGYVIVNAKDVRYNNDTALKVAHNRVAIPVKEFARQRRLTLKEQWELMNPKWAGTFFGHKGEDIWRNQRPTLDKAMAEAIDNDRLDDFMRQFWSAIYGHEEAIKRLTDRAEELERKAGTIHDRYMSLRRKVESVESDIHYCRYEKYHLQGYNVHEYLRELKDELSDVWWELSEHKMKAEAIRNYLKRITFEQQLRMI